MVPLGIDGRASASIRLTFALTLSLTTAACAVTRGPASSAVDANSVAAPPRRCLATASPRVVASRVFVPDGVEVRSEDHGFAIRFAQNKSSCLTLEGPSAAGPFGPSGGSPACPERSGEIAATSDGETMLASESGDALAPHILLGIVTYDVPLAAGAAHLTGSSRGIAWHVFQPPSPSETGARNPKLVSLGDERFLLLWVEGDSEKHQVRAQPLAGWGNAVGPAIDLSLPDMDVIGAPSAAVAPNGEGLVAFLASGERGFDVLVTPIACGERATLQARAFFPSPEHETPR